MDLTRLRGTARHEACIDQLHRDCEGIELLNDAQWTAYVDAQRRMLSPDVGERPS